MNALTDEALLDASVIRRQIESRDLQLANSFSKDAQIQGIRNSRKFLADRLGRTAAPHRILDPDAGPLIGVKLHILTRKTLGGIQTNLSSRALGLDGEPIGGLYAAGEVAGFGGGGVHGYNALEGTFLGGVHILRSHRRPRYRRHTLIFGFSSPARTGCASTLARRRR